MILVADYQNKVKKNRDSVLFPLPFQLNNEVKNEIFTNDATELKKVN